MRKTNRQSIIATTLIVAFLAASCGSDEASTTPKAAANTTVVDTTVADTTVADTTVADTTAGSEPTATDAATPDAGDPLATFEDSVAARWAEATSPLDSFEHEAGPPLQASASIGGACLGSQITACVQWWEQLEAIGKLVGWDVATYDGQIDVPVWNEQLTRAAEAGHDGIAVFGGIPSLSAEGLAAIDETGLPVVGMTSEDPDGVTAIISELDTTIESDNIDIGYLQGVAAYSIGEGKVHAIGGYDGSEISQARQQGLLNFIDECKAAGGDCWAELRTTDTAEMFTQIETFCPSLAQVHPDFNLMVSQVDDITAICIDAVDAAGLLKDGDFGIGVDFNSIAVERIGAGTPFAASVAVPYSSGAWQAIDEINRVLAGQEPLGPENRPWPKRVFYAGNIDLIDATSDVPWDVQLIDPAAFYSELWGLS
jgi:ribose transport system substrate-binding protein